jgi:hypothetical protein
LKTLISAGNTEVFMKLRMNDLFRILTVVKNPVSQRKCHGIIPIDQLGKRAFVARHDLIYDSCIRRFVHLKDMTHLQNTWLQNKTKGFWSVTASNQLASYDHN